MPGHFADFRSSSRLLWAGALGVLLLAAAAYVVAQEKSGAGDTKADGDRLREFQDQVALAEKQIAIKRVAVKVAEARKQIAVTRLVSSRAHVTEAQATESFSEKQFRRLEQLVKVGAVTNELADERRAQWETAKARRATAERDVTQHEFQVGLQEARVELAQLEAQEAELRLTQLKARSKPQR